MHPLLELIMKLTAARDVVDAAFDSDARPWVAEANDFADLAFEHTDNALDAAIVLALASGITIEQIEAATGHAVVKPDWFDH